MGVSFDSRIINIIYGLRNEDSEEFLRVDRSLKYGKIMETITIGSIRWHLNQAKKKAHFLSKGLAKSGKIRHWFICATLMPTIHYSSVIRDRTMLNYAIHDRQKFDVGRIIHEALLGRCTEGLTNSSTIIGLCHLAQVPIVEDEQICPRKVNNQILKVKQFFRQRSISD